MTWHWLNWLVIAIYFGAMMYVGYFFSKRNKSTDDYFRAGGRVPAWVSSCSIYATGFSSISFIAVPASVYAKGWIMGLAPLGIMITMVAVALIFMPFYRRIKARTAYEYLEHRFHKSFRFIGSISFVLFHLIRIAVVLYLPTLALVVALPDVNSIVLTIIVSILCVVYTTEGGIEAVLWSDAIQAIILVAGSLTVIYMGFSAIPGGIGNAFEVLVADKKTLPKEVFQPSLANGTFWAVFIGGIVNSIYQYIGSQDTVQRYTTSPDEKTFRKSIFTVNIPLLCNSIVTFIGMGSATYLFFKYNGGLPESVNGNAIIPYFVIKHLPIGISGFIIAALFAASQSTISSSLNSVATCITSDLVLPFSKGMSDQQALTFAKRTSWVVGIFSTVLAINFILVGQGDIFIYFQAVTGLLGGPMAGLFLLGIFSKRVGYKAAWVGFILSCIVATYLGDPGKLLTTFIPGYAKPSIFAMLIGLLVILSNVIPAYIASFFFPQPTEENLENLTYHTMQK